MYGTFKRFRNTKCIIKYFEVTDEQYESLKFLIHKFEEDKTMYRFNVIGLVGVLFNKKIKRANSFYCAEFVKYALEEAKIVQNELPTIIKPDDFNHLKNSRVKYKGLLRKYEG